MFRVAADLTFAQAAEGYIRLPCTDKHDKGLLYIKT